jgi:gamma-glutamylcyclotransferase (GGCT)/AIG2-like uncharacterized protein YtfP
VTCENLFVYGTLLFDEVVQWVTGRTVDSVRGTLRGFTRHSIKRGNRIEPYPAILPNPRGEVEGRILLSLDEGAMGRIDAYEMDPPEYQQQLVSVSCVDGRVLAASTYVAGPALIPFLKGTWDPERFRRTGLPILRKDIHRCDQKPISD